MKAPPRRIERCNSWCVIDRWTGVCIFCGWPREKQMTEQADGAEIAVTQEMIEAGVVALAEMDRYEPGDVAAARIYRAMRALEPPAEGPKVPQVYDVTEDVYRDVTQYDVDSMEDVVQAYHRLRSAVETVNAQLLRQAGVTRSKHGKPHGG